MGQRTQVLVIKENNKGEKSCHFFHCQWGFGRVMYLGLMDLFMQDYSKHIHENGYNFLNCKFATTSEFRDITDEVPQNVLDCADISNLNTIRDVFDYGDNNNGGMVVYIKENEKEYKVSDFKVGFLLGEEDTECGWDGKVYNEGNDKEAFSRWLTPQMYGRMNGGSNYSDSDFVKMFSSFCRYFGIEYIRNSKRKKANVKAI